MDVELYNTVDRGAVLLERGMGLVRVTGADRVAWLQGMVTNDVARLGPGDGCYAAHLSAQGRVLSHMLILADPDALWLELEQDRVQGAIQELDKLLIMEDVVLEDRSGETAILSLAGAASASLLEGWAGRALGDLPVYGHAVFGEDRAVRTDLGYDIIVPGRRAADAAARLEGAGAVRGDWQFSELLRIEAGIPRYGVDVDATTTFPELGEKGIDYEKGCYIGQEVVAKIKYIGHVNRRFVGFKLEGSDVPDLPSAVYRDGREIGRVTSAAYSPGLASAIALGYVRYGADKPGTTVELLTAGPSRAATVTTLPFVSHTFD